MYGEMLELHNQFKLLSTLQDVSYTQALELSSGVFSINRDSSFLKVAAASDDIGEEEVLFCLM